MNENCCSGPDEPQGEGVCPESGDRGTSVDWLTVAALAAGRIPPRQTFRLCHDPGCRTVYFGSRGAILTTEDVSTVPGFKSGSDGLVCYCFQHRTRDLERDLSARGSTEILGSIRGQVQAQQCACEVKNPTGKCCLGDVQRAILKITREMEVSV